MAQYRPKAPTGVGLYERPHQRGSRKIYLFKSISKLPPKEKLYTIGYNLTSLSYIMPIGALGAIISAPYMIGEAANNLRALNKFVRGDLRALTSRGRFLGSANLINKYASKAINTVRLNTGIGPVDRIASVAIGKQKAQFLQYARGASTKERIQAVSQLNPFKFDKSVQQQAAIPNKGNVFKKWQLTTYMEAYKNAPDPWKDNPYQKARKAERNQKMNTKGYKYKSNISKDSHTLTSDRLNELVHISDDFISDAINVQHLAENDVVDYLLSIDGRKGMRKVHYSGWSPDKKRKAYFDAEARKMGGYLKRQDNVIIDKSKSELIHFGKEGRRPEMLNTREMEIVNGNVVSKIEILPEVGAMMSRKGKRLARAAQLQMMRHGSNDIRGTTNTSRPNFNNLAAELANEEISMELVGLFNNFSSNMGLGFVLDGKAGDNNLQSLITRMSGVLYSLNTNFDGHNFGTGMMQKIATVEKFAEDLIGQGYSRLGLSVIRQFAGGEYGIDEGGRLRIPKREDINLIGAPAGREQGRLVDSLFNMRNNNSSQNKRNPYNHPKNATVRSDSVYSVFSPHMEFDMNQYIDDMEAGRRAQRKIVSRTQFRKDLTADATQRARFIEQWFESSGGLKRKMSPIDTILFRENLLPKEISPSGQLEHVGKFQTYTYSPGNKIFTDFAQVMGFRDIDDFVQNGGELPNMIQQMDYMYDKKYKKELASKRKKQKYFIRESMKAIAEADLRELETEKALEGITRKGNTKRFDAGQSVMIRDHHNFVPTQGQIRASVHMEGPDYKGKNENDGSEYLFRYAVTFGGRSPQSKVADGVRDAVSIEFGGPAHDKQMRLSRRSDRMFYLPSYFMQMSATKAAAFLGVFDKGAKFQASSAQHGVNNMVFKLDDKASIGAFNQLRRSDSSMVKQNLKGHARVKKLFKDLDKMAMNADKANYGNQLNGAVREAHSRALRRFKNAGGFGQVRMSDVFRTSSAKRDFNLGDGQLVFDEKKLGYYKPKGVNRVAQLAGRQHIEGTNYERNNGKALSVYAGFNYDMTRDRLESSYAPIIDVLGSEMLDSAYNTHRNVNVTKKLQRDLIAERKLFQGLTGDLSPTDRFEIQRTQLKNALSMPDDPALANMFRDPYGQFLKEFDLHVAKNGVWDPIKGAVADFQNPNNPYRKFNDLFMTPKFKEQFMREMFEDAYEVAQPLLKMFPEDYNSIMDKITRYVTNSANKFDRGVGNLLFGGDNAGWFTNEYAFRNVLINMAGWLEGMKSTVRVRIAEIAQPYIKNAQSQQAVLEIATKYGHLKKLHGKKSDGFAVLDDALARGSTIMYGSEMGELIEIDIRTGVTKELDYKQTSSLREYYPNPKGRKRQNMTRADNRREILVKLLGADDFDSIDFSKHGRFGAIASEGVDDIIKPYRPEFQDAFEGEWVEEMVNGGLDPRNPMDQLIYYGEVQGDSLDVRMYKQLLDGEEFQANARLSKLLNIKVNTKSDNFGKIVAETKTSKAKYNDFTPQKADIMVTNNTTVGIQTQKYFDEIGFREGEVFHGRGADFGQEFVNAFGSHINSGRMNNFEAYAVIKATLHNLSYNERKHFLNKIYAKLATQSTGHRQSRLRSADAVTKVEQIFGLGGDNQGLLTTIHGVKFQKRLDFFEQLAESIIGYNDINTMQDLLFMTGNVVRVSGSRKKKFRKGFKQNNNQFKGVRSKRNRKGKATGVKDVSGEGFGGSEGQMNYSAYKAFVKNRKYIKITKEQFRKDIGLD